MGKYVKVKKGDLITFFFLPCSLKLIYLFSNFIIVHCKRLNNQKDQKEPKFKNQGNDNKEIQEG